MKKLLNLQAASRHVALKAKERGTWVVKRLASWPQATQQLVRRILSLVRSLIKRAYNSLAALFIFGWKLFRHIFTAPHFEQDQSYRNACEWLESFSADANAVGYDKALEYAWKKFDQMSTASDTQGNRI